MGFDQFSASHWKYRRFHYNLYQMESNSAEGILKKKPGNQQAEHRHIQWDEQSLRLDDLQRGKCQKIDEPKTPYHQYKHDTGDNEEGVMEDLAIKEYLDEAHLNSERNAGKQKLDINKLNQKLYQEMEKAGFSLGSSEPSEDPEQLRKKQEFQKKRKAHYNQVFTLQKPQQQSSGSQAQDT